MTRAVQLLQYFSSYKLVYKTESNATHSCLIGKKSGPNSLRKRRLDSGTFLSRREVVPDPLQRRCNSTVSTARKHKLIKGEDVSIEEKYVRKTPLEHILLRPGMYVGPNERLPPQSQWVLQPPPDPPSREIMDDPSLVLSSPTDSSTTLLSVVQEDVAIVPALIKVFDEILVNASDNRLRHPETSTRIDVLIHPGSKEDDPFIRIYNDGRGIPVEIHPTENMYVPELLFGHLLTGSNFDDNEKRVTGGRHGYGAKLSNIFSKFFTIETNDQERQLHYCQSWANNMTERFDPVIRSANGVDYTCVSFIPDLARLSNDTASQSISQEDYAVMCRRVVDVAGCTAGQLQVTLNGVNVTMESFADYARLLRNKRPEKDALDPPVLFSQVNPRWTVGVGLSHSSSFESVSFVNGMSTHRGGTHINALVQQLIKPIQKSVAKANPELGKLVTQAMVRRNLFVACNALVENPTFDSQMKECLTSNPSSFGSSCDLDKAFLKSVVAPVEEGGPGIIECLIREAKGKEASLIDSILSGKKGGRKSISIPKLEDAHKAGSPDASRACTLILTEGDSAKALAVAGLEVVGRKTFGVFPLRGKFLNVRDASVEQLTKNTEVKALCSILGLDFEKKYETVKEREELRYGHVMLMTDQDHDGSHIKGLIINFFRHFWPGLLKPVTDDAGDEKHTWRTTFLSSFVTPLLKATRSSDKEELSFYTMADYNDWRERVGAIEAKKFRIKYYKGLGTSTPAEAKTYFASFEDHIRPFRWDSDMDGELVDMVFDKKRAGDRRNWILETYDKTNTLSVDREGGNFVGYEDFINNELVHFSQADNIRSIPSVVDGLKPSQRKILFACFKRNLKAEVKVAQLTGYCAEQTAYHHGEASLQSTSEYFAGKMFQSRTTSLLLFAVIGMAQDFVGSNNINLLVPSGQFGTRLEGGSDAASPRYIFTRLSRIVRHLFPEADDVLLDYREDEGQSIEPEFFCPIIPLLLVNGSQGIGTGWSTFIPPHSPQDVLDYIRAKLDVHQEAIEVSDLPAIRPYARGFQGTIEESKKGYTSFGTIEKHTDKLLQIDELPLRCWTTSYKEFLLKLREGGKISSFIENHTTSKVSFTVKVNRTQMRKHEKTGLIKAFKLSKNLATTNMNAFDAQGNMIKYETARDIANAFFPVRLDLYHDRQSLLSAEFQHEAAVLRNKARFIQSVTDSTIDLARGRVSQSELVAQLHGLGFASSQDLSNIKSDHTLYHRRSAASDGPVDGHATGREKPADMDYAYLLNMPLSSLTSERIEKLSREAKSKEEQLETLLSTSAEDMWRNDLDKLAAVLDHE